MNTAARSDHAFDVLLDDRFGWGETDSLAREAAA